MRGQLKDHPDALCLAPIGGPFFAEFKQPGEGLRPGQQKFRDICMERRIPHYVIHSLAEAADAWQRHAAGGYR